MFSLIRWKERKPLILFEMKIFILSLCVSFALSVPVHDIASASLGLLDELSWRVQDQGDDHITYVRIPLTTTPIPTTTRATTRRTTLAPRGASTSFSLNSPQYLGGGRGNLRYASSYTPTSYSTGSESNSNSNSFGLSNDEWTVSTKSDDSITYVRNNRNQFSTRSGGQVQGQRYGQDQGHLRQLGSGQGAVLARVVQFSDNNDSGNDGENDFSQEIAILRQQSSGTGGRTRSPSQTLQRSQGLRTKSLIGGGTRRSFPSTTTTTQLPPTTAVSGDYPRIGDEVNGWIVVDKSNDHISWARAGVSTTTIRSSIHHGGAPSQLGRSRNERLQLKSLEGNSRKSQGRKVPSAEGQLVEGFPRVFNTYSQSSSSSGLSSRRNIEDGAVGSIRTTLRNTENWNIGDELSGWKVISMDGRGLVWEKMPASNQGSQGRELNEEDFINKYDNVDEDDEKHFPGVWYIRDESENSITWARDNVPEETHFDMDAYPRVGDVMTGWQVKSKSKEHIKWVRINEGGAEIISGETY